MCLKSWPTIGHRHKWRKAIFPTGPERRNVGCRNTVVIQRDVFRRHFYLRFCCGLVWVKSITEPKARSTSRRSDRHHNRPRSRQIARRLGRAKHSLDERRNIEVLITSELVGSDGVINPPISARSLYKGRQASMHRRTNAGDISYPAAFVFPSRGSLSGRGDLSQAGAKLRAPSALAAAQGFALSPSNLLITDLLLITLRPQEEERNTLITNM